MLGFNQQVLVIDCQTTNRHPKNGLLLQLGWCTYDAQASNLPVIHKRLIRLPQDTRIPGNVLKLLSIEEQDFSTAVEPVTALMELEKAIKRIGPSPIVIAHYIQFELSFLKHYFLTYLHRELIEFIPVCTQKISKQIFPYLPSYTLKGLAGYFAFKSQPYHDVTSHITATIDLWSRLIKAFGELNLIDYASLSDWLKTKNNKSKKTYHYRIEPAERLSLPKNPGIYKMINQKAEVLYVGKATSLYHRVNSYFRGVKNRDKQKLEMIAQVWRIETVECETLLEAELLESDEIKRLNPPYNILLKQEARNLVFYDRTFTKQSTSHTLYYNRGPFRTINAVELLLQAQQSLKQKTPILWFDRNITTELLADAWLKACESMDSSIETITKASARQLLAIACRQLRQFEQRNGQYKFETWWAQQKKVYPQCIELTQQAIADKIIRLFIRAAESLRKARELSAIYQTSWTIVSTNKPLLVNQSLACASSDNPSVITIPDYDKLALLAAAKRKKLIIPTR